jgi:hypothetical protein
MLRVAVRPVRQRNIGAKIPFVPPLKYPRQTACTSVNKTGDTTEVTWGCFHVFRASSLPHSDMPSEGREEGKKGRWGATRVRQESDCSHMEAGASPPDLYLIGGRARWWHNETVTSSEAV